MTSDPKQSKDGPLIGLALGGGAALGWAHIGALRVLAKNGIEAGVIAGTSIGALVGACAVCGVLDPLEDIARAMTWRKMLGYADPLLGAPGLFKGAAVINEMSRYIGGKNIEDLRIPFIAVAADLITGTEVRLSEGLLTEAVRASISIPGVFLPVEKAGALLVDGGLVNPVPVSAVRHYGPKIVIAIDVTGDYSGRARAAGIGMAPSTIANEAGGAVRPNWMQSMAARLFRQSERRPGLYSVATTSAAFIMRELAQAKMALEPPDLHVLPEVGHISPVEFDRADELIEAGRIAMEKKLPALMSLIHSSRNPPA